MPSAPRNTGSQRALDPNAPRPSNPANAPIRRNSSGAIPAVPSAPRNTGSQRALDPNAPRQSNPAMRRVSNPSMPRVSGSHPAHPAPPKDAGDGPTEAGVALPGADAPTGPRVSGTHRALNPKAGEPKKKKGGAGKTIAFALAVMLVFGVGVLWVLKHPELFPGANAVATDVHPPVKQPLLKAPPHELPPDPAATPPPKADEAKPAEVAAEAAKPAEAPPAADDSDDEIAKPEPGKPAHHAATKRPKAKTVAKAEPAEAAPVEKPKEEAPPPSGAQLAEKTEQLETLLTQHESVRGPDPVMRGFLANVKAETAAADTDDKKRQAWAHLNQLQARLSK
ncbi:MAG: hypothetical protein QM723_11125 [Myxococcaceae bacterium]